MSDEKKHDHTGGDACQSCGGSHAKDPYSKEVMTAFEDWQKATDPALREELFHLLAERFAASTDSSDCSLTDVAHDAVDAYRGTKLAFEQASASLGRLLVRALQAHTARKAMMEKLSVAFVTVPTPPPPETKGNVN